MAIDTASKRHTILNLAYPGRMLTSVPDGSSSAGDRIGDGGLYSGLAAEIVTAGFVCMRDHHSYTYITIAKATGTILASMATGTVTIPIATGTLRC